MLNPMTNDLLEYRNAAFERAKNKTDSRILNDSLAHAQILIESMIGTTTSEDEVGIYSGTLPESCYRSVLENAAAKSILIAVEDESNLNWLNSLNREQLSKIQVSKVSKKRPNHFFYTTGGAFRFELDSEKFKAEANFNEPSVVNTLKLVLGVYLSDATPVNITQ